MNDASEVLGVIFECLHKSYTSRTVCHGKSHEKNSIGSWDCANISCIAHSLFGMDVYERMNCHNCKLESRRLKYTSFSTISMLVHSELQRLVFFVWLNLIICALCILRSGELLIPNYSFFFR